MKCSSSIPDPSCESVFLKKLEEKLNLHKFYREVCTNFPLKKALNLKKVALCIIPAASKSLLLQEHGLLLT